MKLLFNSLTVTESFPIMPVSIYRILICTTFTLNSKLKKGTGVTLWFFLLPFLMIMSPFTESFHLVQSYHFKVDTFRTVGLTLKLTFLCHLPTQNFQAGSVVDRVSPLVFSCTSTQMETGSGKLNWLRFKCWSFVKVEPYSKHRVNNRDTKINLTDAL